MYRPSSASILFTYLRILLWFLVPWVPGSSFAQQWSEFAYISQTLGVNANRLCIGEASRGELGCPAYAPYIAPNGYLGMGTETPISPLSVQKPTSGSVAFFTVSTTTDTSSFGLYLYTQDEPTIYLRDTAMLYAALTTPNLQLTAASSTGIIRFNTGQFDDPSSERMRVTNNGVGIGTISPTARLDVSGTARATVVQLGNNPANTCDAAALGTIKTINGKLFTCRQ